MADALTNLEILSTRAGFNSAVRHIKKTIKILDTLGTNDNLGDILFELADREITGERIAIILRMLLVDKFGYKTVSVNLVSAAEDPQDLALEFARWKAVDLVAAYHHPDLGLIIANPKVAGELANFGALRKRELLIIYAGKADAPADGQCALAAELAASLFEGAKPEIPGSLYNGKFITKRAPKAPPPQEAGAPPKGAVRAPSPAKAASSRAASQGPAKANQALPAPQREAGRAAAPVVTAAAPAITKGPLRMTPMYSVAVQNELFHNGNVEAWKRIIDSYNAKYPELHVYIYYEGERILDINSLFKWGKVKHGSSIQFAVAGNDIKDVAKLQRYLVQGASHQFEAFLRGSVSTVLNLF
ncbi:MAG: hypothetical protein LBT16_10055 [Treponema sp.]|jgi:hypothetical protein|nr:hypothetical protein [Treponema sp.]